MSDTHERLQQARIAAGYDDAASAARAMGLRPETYQAHENGNRGLTRGGAGERYARFFRVSLEWLLTGRGAMKGRGSGQAPLFGTVGAGSSVEPIGETAWADAPDYIDLPDPADIFILRVTGDSGYPRYEDGDLLLVDRQPVDPAKMIGRYCVLDLADGRRVVKRLQKIDGIYMLVSENKETKIEKAPMIIACYRIRGSLE